MSLPSLVQLSLREALPTGVRQRNEKSLPSLREVRPRLRAEAARLRRQRTPEWEEEDEADEERAAWANAEREMIERIEEQRRFEDAANADADGHWVNEEEDPAEAFDALRDRARLEQEQAAALREAALREREAALREAALRERWAALPEWRRAELEAQQALARAEEARERVQRAREEADEEEAEAEELMRAALRNRGNAAREQGEVDELMRAAMRAHDRATALWRAREEAQ